MKTMSKVLLDGYGVTLKAVRGVIDKTCPYNRDEDKEGYREIVIETNKGNFIICGCSQCHVLSWLGENSE